MKLFEQKSGSQKMRNFFFLLVIFICVVGTYYIYSSFNAKQVVFENADGTKFPVNVSDFENKEILNINTGTSESLSFKNSDYTLIILLSTGDCSSCLSERKIWSDFSKKYDTKKLQVAGVLIKSSVEEAKTLIKAFDFPFPVFFDEANQLSDFSQNLKVTPFKILLKNSGEVLLVDGPNPTLEAQRSFGEKVANKLLGN